MSTAFYSNARNSDVNIPNNKVCGYKISNRAMSDGWSSGVRSGRDNGVENRKFSRFATDCEAADKNACAGNTNWLNFKRGMDLKEPKPGTRFEIKREKFKAGQPMIPLGLLTKSTSRSDITPDINIKNNRSGTGNRNITRPMFKAPPVQPRRPISFDKLQLLNEELFGKKVQLSEKTLSRLFDVKIPDSSDTAWLSEKRRLTMVMKRENPNITLTQIAERFLTNPPLGRPQRTVTESRNITDQGISIESKLNILKNKIASGRAESRDQQAEILGQFALVLGNAVEINQMSAKRLEELGVSLAALNVPLVPKQMGIDARIVDEVYYDDARNSGLINIYFLSQALRDDEVTLDKPVKNVTGSRDPIIKLSAMNTAVRRADGKRYIDLNDRKLLTKDEMRAAVALIPGGFDSPSVSVAVVNQ